MDPLILVRFVHFAATVTAAGAVWFALLMAAPASGAALGRQLRKLTWAALAVAALSGAVWLVWLTSDILGVPIADVWLRDGVFTVLTDTRFGQVWAARLGLIVLLAALLPWRRTLPLQAALAVPLIALPALTGHAGAAPGQAAYGAIAADMAHLIAAGCWLGGLPAFALMLAAGRTDDALVVRTTRRFATAAAASVATLLATGLINGLSLLNGPADLVATDYGQVLLIKVGLFGVMLVIAAVNRFHLTPALPATAARWALAGNTVAETMLGLGVLLLVGALGTLPPGGHAHQTDGAIPPDAAFVHIHSTEAMADVTIAPGRVGVADATMRVMREDYTEFPARDVRLALDPPGASGKPLERAAVRQPDGRWRTTEIEFSQDGIWTVRVIVTPETGSVIVLDAPVVISR
jgi:putative copper resistance protein D